MWIIALGRNLCVPIVMQAGIEDVRNEFDKLGTSEENVTV